MDYGPWKIILDLPSGQPKLGFDRFSEAFRDIIVNSEPQFAIAIFGGWGSGKTTLMKGIRRALENSNREDIIPVDFSAWRYEKEDHLIVPLLDSIRDAIVNWQKDYRKFRKIATQTARVIGGVTHSILSGLAIKAKLPGALEVSFDANKSLKAAEDLGRAEELERIPRSSYYASFAALQSAFERFAGQETQRRIVVFIDDLDRCLPEGALQVIESMKLFFDLPGFVFVVGLDRQVVEWCIDINYRKATGQTGPSENTSYQVRGSDYVKKIFQVPFALSPVSTTQIDDFLNAVFNEAGLPATQQGEIRNLVRPHLDYLVTRDGINPREIKRYINAYTLTMKTKPLDKVFEPNVVLTIQTMAFTPEWQLAYDALIGSRANFINALHDRVNGNSEALVNLDPNLTAIPPRFLEYVSQNSPGAQLLTTGNIDDYIHLGAAALDADTLTVSRKLLEVISRFRDLRQKTLKVHSAAGVDANAAAETLAMLEQLSSEIESNVQGPKYPIIAEGIAALRSAAGQTDAKTGTALEDWQRTINTQFNLVLAQLSEYLRSGRRPRLST